MGNGFQFIDIIFFALIAVFLILRLRSVLGRRIGHEDRNTDPYGVKRETREQAREAPINGSGGETVISLPGTGAEETAAQTPLGAGLTQIKLADPGFDAADFQDKAKAAFEYIVMAFAEGEAKKLKPLLSPDVYAGFADAIKERQSRGETLQTTLVRIKEAELTEAEMHGTTASVTVRYVTEQINVTRDKDGKVVDGDPDHITEAVDVWTYERNARSSDPNWLLVATETPD